jgi:hypothetical protein
MFKLSEKTTLSSLNLFVDELACESPVKGSIVVNLKVTDTFIEGHSHSPSSLNSELSRWLKSVGIQEDISIPFANEVVNDGSTLMMALLCQFDITYPVQQGYFYLPAGTKLSLVDVDHHRVVKDYIVKKNIIINAEPVLISFDLDKNHRVFFESDGLGQRCRWLGKKQFNGISHLAQSDICTGQVIGSCTEQCTVIAGEDVIELDMGRRVEPGTDVKFSKSTKTPI